MLLWLLLKIGKFLALLYSEEYQKCQSAAVLEQECAGWECLCLFIVKSIRNRGEIVISGFLFGFVSARLIAC